MEFLPISSSSAGCSYVLTSKGIPALLIDPGISIARIREALNFSVTSLAGALVSHHHGDHSKSAIDLANSCVRIYASEECLAEIGELPASKKTRYWSHYARVLEPGRLMGISGWEVLPFLVPHDAPGTLGFFISDGQDRLFYLTDALYSPVLPDKPTIIAIEANHDPEIMSTRMHGGEVDPGRFRRTRQNHMSIGQAINSLRAFDLSACREIWLLHLSDSHSDEAAFAQAVREATGIPTRVAAKTTRK